MSRSNIVFFHFCASMVDWRCPGIVWRAGRERRTPGVNGRRPLIRRDYFEAMSAHLDTGIFGCKRSGWDWGNGFPNEGPNDSDSISGVGGSTTGSLSWKFIYFLCLLRGDTKFYSKKYLKEICHVMAYSRNCIFSAFSIHSKCTKISVSMQ